MKAWLAMGLGVLSLLAGPASATAGVSQAASARFSDVMSASAQSASIPSVRTAEQPASTTCEIATRAWRTPAEDGLTGISFVASTECATPHYMSGNADGFSNGEVQAIGNPYWGYLLLGESSGFFLVAPETAWEVVHVTEVYATPGYVWTGVPPGCFGYGTPILFCIQTVGGIA